jgi:hypothetical protein
MSEVNSGAHAPPANDPTRSLQTFQLGKHEKQLLDLDKQHALAAFGTHFTIGQSLTHQISSTAS